MASSLGEQLRKLREERGLTLEQVWQGTHIRVQYLKALENDDRASLPSAVQGKGFLRVYANFLNVPVQPFLDLWDGKIAPEEPALPEQDEETKETPVVEPVEELVLPELAPEYEPEESYAERPEPEFSETTSSPSVLLPSQQIFAEIGTQLRMQREAVSLSLADVERFTKVRLHYLKALEEGRIDDLPSPVQGRGMLSNYAHFLNLNTEVILLKFADALQARRLERMTPAEKSATRSTTKKPAEKQAPAPKSVSQSRLTLRRIITPDLMIGGGLVLLLLVFVLWGAARINRLSASAEVATPPSISEILQITATPSITPTLNAMTPMATQALVAQPIDSEGTPGVEGTPGEAVEVPTTTAPIQVYVVSHQRAFLRITADGKQIFNGRTTPGAAYTFTAKEKLELLSGNAAALQIFYQQEDLGTLGVVGEVISMIFTPEEIITPTPAFTNTPHATGTPAATATPGPTKPAPTITPYLP